MKIVLDIETTSTHDVIWCCVTRDMDTDEVIVWKAASGLQKYLDNCDLIIMQNGINFDAQILRKVWNVTMRLSQVSDTLVLSRLLNPSLEGGHSLDAWGTRLGFPKGDFKDWDGGLTEEMITYCVQDTLVTAKLYDHLINELNSKGFSQRSIELEHNVQAIITKQEVNGFKLDQRNALQLLSELKTKLDAIEVEMQIIFPAKVESNRISKLNKPLKDIVTPFNPGSRKQIGERLIERGWKPSKFTETGQPIVDEVILADSVIPEAKAIAEYLMLQKRIAQIDSWLNELKEDGRVHGRVITNGAVTGRMTHRNPNMAQVPNSGSPYGEECRNLWIVEKGYKLVGIDASGLELRMLAHYMNDDEYTHEIIQGDIHWKNTISLGFYSKGTLRDKKDQGHEQARSKAKTFIYAFLYGAGAAKIGTITGGNAKEGQKLIDNFLQNTPKLLELRQKVSRISAKEGALPSLDGRKIFIRSEHSAVNTLLQGAGAIVMKQALVILDKSLKRAKIDYKFVANVHDEWQVEVKESEADAVGGLGVKAIELAGVQFSMRCPLTGEYKVGNSWKETH
jgi:DNA polymerase I-like protein with 3'-5' exonuclease and polymerase domains